MKNTFRIFLVILFGGLLSGCAGGSKSNANSHPRTLDAAAEWQANKPEQAIVLMTIEALGKEDTLHPLVEGFVFGKNRTSMTGMSFAGSPYHVKSEALRKFQENSQKMLREQDAGAKTVALGGFRITEKQEWALVQPGKYAIHKYFSRTIQMADMRGWGRQDGKAYMVFDIEPGDVVYLGHVKADLLKNGTISVQVEDRFDSFRNTLPPALQQKMQKRIIRTQPILHPEKVERLNRYNVH